MPLRTGGAMRRMARRRCASFGISSKKAGIRVASYCSKNSGTSESMSAKLLTETSLTSNPLARKSLSISTKSGNSTRHGPHHVAQKFIKTGFLFSLLGKSLRKSAPSIFVTVCAETESAENRQRNEKIMVFLNLFIKRNCPRINAKRREKRNRKQRRCFLSKLISRLFAFIRGQKIQYLP